MDKIYIISDAAGFSNAYNNVEAAQEHMQIFEPEGGIWHVQVVEPSGTIISC